MTQSQANRRNVRHTRVAYVALMVALALIFSYVEAIIPYDAAIPGVKLGIANIVTIIALYRFTWKDAITVSIIRIIIAGLLFNGIFGAMYSLAGAMLSFAGMQLLRQTKIFSVVGISLAGGVLHNLGQLVVASYIIEDVRIFAYFPVLLFSGIAAGIAVGIAALLVLERLKRL